MKIAIYVLVIATIILGLLLSMLNLENHQEFVVAKWAICGILSVIVIALSLLDFQFFSKIARCRISIQLVIRVLAIPLLVVVFAAVGFALIGRDDLSEKIFIQAPLLPVFLIFFASIAIHLTYAYLRRSKS